MDFKSHTAALTLGRENGLGYFLTTAVSKLAVNKTRQILFFRIIKRSVFHVSESGMTLKKLLKSELIRFIIATVKELIT